jgi:glycosyltransferase involved in cell wall biosynthesis
MTTCSRAHDVSPAPVRPTRPSRRRAQSAEARPPRILYLLSHPIQYQVPLLRFLADRGNVHVHTLFASAAGAEPYFDPGFGQSLAWDLPMTEGYSHEFMNAWGGQRTPGRVWPLSLGLRRVMREFSPDAVWVHGYDRANSIRLIGHAKSMGIPVFVRAEVENSDALGGRVTRSLKDLVLRAAYSQFDAFLAIGKRNADFYRQRGVPQSKIFSAPYAIDNSVFSAAMDSVKVGPTLQSEYDVPESTPVFITSGKLIDRKRPLDPIRALSILRDDHGVDAALLVIGSGPLKDACAREVTLLGLDDRVRFAGFMNQTQIRSAYPRATALLLTSARERWGLVANEAMAGGCPVVVYRSVGCAEDLVVDGVSGLVVDTGDLVGLSAAMAQLADPQQQRQLREGALARVEHFSFEAVERALADAVTHTHTQTGAT